MDKVNMRNNFVVPEIAEYDPKLIKAISALEEYTRTYNEVSRRFETALESGIGCDKYSTAMDELSDNIADIKRVILEISGAEESFFESDEYKKISTILNEGTEGVTREVKSHQEAQKKAEYLTSKKTAETATANKGTPEEEKLRTRLYTLGMNMYRKLDRPIRDLLEDPEEALKLNEANGCKNELNRGKFDTDIRRGISMMVKAYNKLRNMCNEFKIASAPALPALASSAFDELSEDLIDELSVALEAAEEINDADEEDAEANSEKKPGKEIDDEEIDTVADEYEVRAIDSVNRLREKVLKHNDEKIAKLTKEHDIKGVKKYTEINKKINDLCGKDGCEINAGNYEAIRKEIGNTMVVLTPAMEEIKDDEEIQEAVALMESLMLLSSDNSHVVDFMTEKIADIVDHKIYKTKMNFLRNELIGTESLSGEGEDEESTVEFDDIDKARHNMDLVARMARVFRCISP